MQSMITLVLPEKKIIKHLLHNGHHTTTTLHVCLSTKQLEHLKKHTNIAGRRQRFWEIDLIYLV